MWTMLLRLLPGRDTSIEILQFPTLAKVFLKGVWTNKIRLTPFFIRTCIEARFAQFSTHPYIPVTHDLIDVQPFLKSCLLFTQPNILAAKVFRTLCTASQSHPIRPLTLKNGCHFGNFVFFVWPGIYGIDCYWTNWLVDPHYIEFCHSYLYYLPSVNYWRRSSFLIRIFLETHGREIIVTLFLWCRFAHSL